MRKAKHRVLPFEITFIDSDNRHDYIDNEGSDYISATTLVHRFFPEFDSAAASARIAAREGVAPAEIISRWNAKRDASTDYGTRVHNYAEACVKRVAPPAPLSDKDSPAFNAVDEALRMIRGHYDILGSECMVFDPVFRVAGTIDLPLRHRATGRYCIADWKTNEAIDVTPRFPGCGLPPIQHIPDCNGNHYRLQFAIYAEIMRGSGYVPFETEFSNVIIYIPPMVGKPVWIPLPDAPAEARALLEAWEREFFTVENMQAGTTVADFLKAPRQSS